MEKLKEFEFKLSSYFLALNIIGFDNETIGNIDGQEYRNERVSYLSGEYYKILTDEKMYSYLKEIDLSKLNEIDKRKVQLYIKKIDETKLLTVEEYIEFSKLELNSMAYWKKARKENNYKIYEPYLKQIIQFKKIIAEKINKNNPYDFYLDLYEEGMNSEKYDEFFTLLKNRIVPLIKKIIQKQNFIDDSILHENYDINLQKQFINDLLKYLDFNSNWGYLSISTHPFSSAISKNDVRITTRYMEDDILSSIYSVIHEAGHGTYENQINDEFDGTIIQNSISMGMHESQSRLFENYLGKSKSFWKYNYNEFKKTFKQFNDLSIDEFYKKVNISKPSFIRTESDELTYPLHILVRYEIEKGIFNNTIDINNLDKVFADMMEEYVGLRPTTDLQGILQDIHWCDGSFGYFPTYALGSAYAAQIYNAMSKEIDVNYCLENNEFTKIKKWLKENIHQYASLYKPEDILLKATKEKFNPKYYIEYLENKFKEIYKI